MCEAFSSPVGVNRTASPLLTAELDLDAQRPTDYDCRCFFLHRPRAELYRRIDGRVEEMMAGGLLTVSFFGAIFAILDFEAGQRSG